MQHSRTRLLSIALGLALLISSGVAFAADDDWPTYHHSADRAGVAAGDSWFTDVAPSWTSTRLDGAVYAEPLYVGGRVLVATENNTLYAFDAASGGPIWQTHLADPVSADDLPCGNIRPTVGITSTPTVDASTGVLYAVAMVQRARYELYALDLGSGVVNFHRALDPPGLDAKAAGQRGALGLQQGLVYVPFGGRYGDCGNYRGRVVGASAYDPAAPLVSYTTPARSAGIWSPSGVAIADDGTVLVATGNGDANGPEGRTEAVLALSPNLDELDSWQPRDWRALDRTDTDIGSMTPVVLPDMGLVFQAGKNGQGYVMRRGALGGVGGEVFSDDLPAGCGGVYGGPAYASPLLYLPCAKRVIALQISANPPGFSLAWRGPDQKGQPTVGSPIVAAGAVWSIDYTGRVLALDAANGAQRFAGQLPGLPGHFGSLAYGGGQIYAASAQGVAAFQLVGLSGPASEP